MMAEDNMINQKVLFGILVQLGVKPAHIIVANNGQEAVDWFEVNHGLKRCDVVLMDIRMPKLDGLEATKMIRASHGTPYEPFIVALTANAMPSDQKEALDSGMNDFLPKPVRLKALGELFDRYLQKL